ncbi:MAG TPA: hypothetical protein VM582_07440, partial [Candidatus Thermoplasmatota archaeon]|nr:hypothetical protein [Candidatus Thermoplasmatota archaeon]
LSETWDWQAAAPVGRLAFEAETHRFADASLAAPTSWRRQSLELEGVPARITVAVPGHGALAVEASGVIGSATQTRHAYDFATLRERYHSISATGVPASVLFAADDVSGAFQSTGSLGRVAVQSASLDVSPAPGDIGRLLFDLSSVTTNFVGVRGETATSGRVLALQVVNVPESVSFTLGEAARGVDLSLSMSRGLGEVNGIVQVDGRRGTIHLSNIPKTIHLHAQFDAATVRAGYDASSGVNAAQVSFTDLARASSPGVVHAYVQLLQLPRTVSFALTRAGDAPRLEYSAVTSTADVRALVHEDLFGGDLKARALVSIDDLGASTTLALERVGAQDVLRLVSVPRTERIFVEGFVQQAYKGGTSQHLRNRCCWDAFGYDVRYGYDMDATLRVENLRIQLLGVSSLELGLRAPDVSVTGTFTDFTVAWDTLSIIGRSSAWLRVDLVVFWVGINVWNWGWSSATQYNLNVLITRYVDQWGPLASVTVSPCTFSIDVRPYAVETMVNAFRIPGLAGQRQYLFLNPLGSGGQPAVPPWLAAGYMAWRHGEWSLGFRC